MNVSRSTYSQTNWIAYQGGIYNVWVMSCWNFIPETITELNKKLFHNGALCNEVQKYISIRTTRKYVTTSTILRGNKSHGTYLPIFYRVMHACFFPFDYIRDSIFFPTVGRYVDLTCRKNRANCIQCGIRLLA